MKLKHVFANLTREKIVIPIFVYTCKVIPDKWQKYFGKISLDYFITKMAERPIYCKSEIFDHKVAGKEKNLAN